MTVFDPSSQLSAIAIMLAICMENAPADLVNYSRNYSESLSMFNPSYQHEAISPYAKILLEIFSRNIHTFFTAKKSI